MAADAPFIEGMVESASATALLRPDARAPAGHARVRAMFEGNYDFIWRSLRRLGVLEANVDDAAQEVFLVATRRLSDIVPGKERAFLFSTAMRVASDARRSALRRRESIQDDAGMEAIDPSPSAEDLADQKRARELLDRVLETMPLELRSVFVLYELEDLTMADIAQCLDQPPGTVASRLRRAREHFQRTVDRMNARARGAR